MPSDLFEELIAQNPFEDEWKTMIPELRKIHRMTQRILQKSDIQMMLYESVLFNFAISGELDFFNHKMILSVEQRMRYLVYLQSLFENNFNISVKMIRRNFASDYRYRINPCLFLSDRISYIRVENKKYHNNIMTVNHVVVKNMFDDFYKQIWEFEEEHLIDDNENIGKGLEHLIKSLYIMAEIE